MELWKQIICDCRGTEFHFESGMAGDRCWHCNSCGRAKVPEESVEDGKVIAFKGDLKKLLCNRSKT